MSGRTVYPRLGQAIFLLVALLVVQFLIGVVIVLFCGRVSGGSSPAIHPAAIGIGNVLSFAIVLSWAARKSRRPLREVFPFRRFRPVLLLTLPVLLIGLGIIASEADNVLRYFMPMPQSVAEIMRSVASSGAASFFTVALVAPVTEELLFRSIILGGLLSRYGPRKAILISTVLFCLSHLNPYQFFSAFVVGVVLGWLFYRTGSLWPCIIGHTFYNLCLVLAVALLPVTIPGFTPESLGWSSVQFQPPWFDVLGLALLAAGAIGLAKSLRAGNARAEQLRPAESEDPDGVPHG